MRRFILPLAMVLVACGGDAGPSGTTMAPTEVSVVVAGVAWSVPLTACEGDPEAAAHAAAERVRNLVAERTAGWPTTTRPLPGAEAEFFVAVNRAGPTALVLAAVAGTTDAVVASWSAFEAGFADLPDSPGPVTVIADRLPGWQVTARAIVAALDGACP